jgi:dolichol-phosphate mannosyltransferase
MLYIVLPAYNEERDLGALLGRIREEMTRSRRQYAVLVVDDGSTDGTAAVAKRFARYLPLELLVHERNQGLGTAITTGLRRAAGLAMDGDVVVTMDADNTHDPRLIAPMLEQIRKDRDVVIASRYETGGEEVGLSRLRHVLSRGASVLLGLSFPVDGARDYTCGYRAYRSEILRLAFDFYGDRFIEESGFTCMAEILIKLRRLTARVGEVPLVLRYDLKSGQSKMKVLRTIWRYLILIVREGFAPGVASA